MLFGTSSGLRRRWLPLSKPCALTPTVLWPTTTRATPLNVSGGNERHNEHTKELYGFSPHTTNNRMELTAAIEGLRAIKEPCEVEVVTDSEYLKNGITTWIHNWKRSNWLTSAKKAVVNQDLWMDLDEQVARHKATWVWTKGALVGNNLGAL